MHVCMDLKQREDEDEDEHEHEGGGQRKRGGRGSERLEEIKYAFAILFGKI